MKALFEGAVFSMLALSAAAAAESSIPVAQLSPKICADNILVLPPPMYPRHVEYRPLGCSVTIEFEVLSSGEVNRSDSIYRSTKPSTVEPENCSVRYISELRRSLRKARFAVSEDSYQCTYTRRMRLLP